MKLKPYDPKAACPKCGSKKVGTHHRGHIDHDPGWYDRRYNPPNKWPQEEYLHRTCKDCGYDWPEACKSKAA